VSPVGGGETRISVRNNTGEGLSEVIAFLEREGMLATG
jgi:hypothetical protein